MKKIFTIFAALTLVTTATKATGTNENSTSANSVENNLASAPAAISARSFAEILEENNQLRDQVQQLNVETGNLQSKLEYSFMMHSAIKSLDETILNNAIQKDEEQSAYAKLMTSTIINLNKVLATN